MSDRSNRKEMKGPQNPPLALGGNRPEAGDVGHAESDAESEEHVVIYPEDISKRLNALKNIHMDIQKLDLEMHKKIFEIEAEIHKKMESLLKKRSDVVTGAYEPSGAETKFQLKENEPDVPVKEASGEKGIPKFWLTVLQNGLQTQGMIEDHDEDALQHLTDIRAVYTEKPMGFKLEFVFSENPYFTNQVLTRSYEFDDTVAKEDIYINSSLSPKSTSGTEINWKEGKNLRKKVVLTFQRNKKTNERRQVKNEADQDTFFKFFSPVVTDLIKLMKPLENEEDSPAEVHQKHMEEIQDAEMEYELASYIRTHVIPKALLIFTGEDDDEADFSDEEDYDEDDDEDEESDEEGGGDHEDEDDEDDDEDVPTGGKHDKKGLVGNGRAGGHAHGVGKAHKGHRH